MSRFRRKSAEYFIYVSSGPLRGYELYNRSFYSRNAAEDYARQAFSQHSWKVMSKEEAHLEGKKLERRKEVLKKIGHGAKEAGRRVLHGAEEIVTNNKSKEDRYEEKMRGLDIEQRKADIALTRSEAFATRRSVLLPEEDSIEEGGLPAPFTVGRQIKHRAISYGERIGERAEQHARDTGWIEQPSQPRRPYKIPEKTQEFYPREPPRVGQGFYPGVRIPHVQVHEKKSSYQPPNWLTDQFKPKYYNVKKVGRRRRR